MNRGVLIGGAVFGGLGVLVLGTLGYVATQPSSMHVERSAVIAASPADIYPFANDLDKWQTWNPWGKMDPTMKVEFGEKHADVGAWYSWKGEQMGAGKMTITANSPDQTVVYDLAFTEPFESSSVVTISLAPEGDGTRVTWGFDQDSLGFMEKGFGMVVDMDSMLGKDFDSGLANLKIEAEKVAADRVAAEKAALQAAPPVDPAAVPADGVPPEVPPAP